MSTVENTNSTPLVNSNPSTSEIITPKKYAKRTIEMIGLSSCGHCSDTESFIKSELTPNSDVPVEFKLLDANSPEGRVVVEQKKLKNVPYIKECLIPTEPDKQPDCKEINEYRKEFFKTKVNSD